MPLSAALLCLVLQIGWSWSRHRARRWLYGGLLAWLAFGWSPPGLQEQVRPADAPPIAISFWAYTDFRQVPAPVLEDLRAQSAPLYLHAPTETFEGEEAQRLADGLRRLAAYDVPVVLMPPADDFLSTPVHRQWVARARLAAAFVRRFQFANVEGLIGDAEAPMHTPLDLMGRDAAEVDAATQALRTLIATIHRDEPQLRIGVTAQWPLFLDGVDGDADLAVVARSPVDPPGGWDFVNVMNYSSYRPPKERPYWVVSLIRGRASRYPQRPASRLIGLVGRGMPSEPLLSFDELVRDARLCRALGVREVVVFQLNGALALYGDDFVRRFAAAVNAPEPVASRCPSRTRSR